MKHTLHFFLITIFLLSGINSFAENKSNDTYACPTATISYVGTPFCASDTSIQNVTLTGTDAYLGGVFISTSGLTLNPTTGAITPNTSTPGVYTVLYTIAANGSCPAVNVTTLVTVLPSNTVTSASSFPVLCINTYMTTITHSTTGATGMGIPTGLPTGVTASWSSNTITISGTPTVAGVFNYSIPITGGCGSGNATGTIVVSASNTVSIASSFPTLCINTPLTPITHTTTGATGIIQSGLPVGVTASWSGNTITISGTPTMAGVFNYTIFSTGGCGTVNATGTIIVSSNTVSNASSTPTLCINTPVTPITHTVTGATGMGVCTGLPAGLTASWSSGMITITGTPVSAGVFNYTVPLTGGCGTTYATGTITVVMSPGNATISGGTSICSGGSANLTVTSNPGVVFTMTDGSNLYTYTIGSSGIITIPVFPTVNTTYTLTSASLNGCSIPLNQSTTVNVAATPQFITQIPDITICNGETLNIASQLTSTLPGTTYTWNATTSNVNMASISGNHTNIDQIVNLINSSINGTISISVIPQIGSCYGTPQQILVTVKPIPVITSTVANHNVICNNQFVTITTNSYPYAMNYNWQVSSATGVQIVGGVTNGTSTTGIVNVQLALINSLTAGTISFNITPTNGNCIGATITNAVTITVNPTPGAPISLPSYNICSGETANLIIATSPNIAGTTLEWTVTDSQNVTGFSNGTVIAPSTINDVLYNTSNVQGFVKYSVTTKLGNCEGGTTEYIVHVNPLPDTSVLTDGEITVDENGNLIPYVLDTGLDTFNYTFEWYLNNTIIPNATSNTYTATEEGNYSVNVFNMVTNCSGVTYALVTENLVNDNGSVDLVMFPNPSFDNINFSYNNKVMSVQISNQMGQTVLYKDLNTKTGTIDLSDLNTGIYNIVFETESGIVNQRIIKQ